MKYIRSRLSWRGYLKNWLIWNTSYAVFYLVYWYRPLDLALCAGVVTWCVLAHWWVPRWVLEPNPTADAAARERARQLIEAYDPASLAWILWRLGQYTWRDRLQWVFHLVLTASATVLLGVVIVQPLNDRWGWIATVVVLGSSIRWTF